MFNAPLWILFQSTSYALNVVADVPTTGHAIDLIPTRITQLTFKIEENL